MSAGSAPGAVPLSACGSILRATNVHFRLTVVETHVDAVPASVRADHGDRDEDCACPTNRPHGALLKLGDVPDEQLASAVQPRLQPPAVLCVTPFSGARPGVLAGRSLPERREHAPPILSATVLDGDSKTAWVEERRLAFAFSFSVPATPSAAGALHLSGPGSPSSSTAGLS